MATRVDLGSTFGGQPLFIGTAATLIFTLTPPASTSGWSVRLQFKRAITDAAYLAEYTPTNTDSGAGIWTQALTRAQTLMFTVTGTYAYSLERIDSGAETVLSYGEMYWEHKVRN